MIGLNISQKCCADFCEKKIFRVAPPIFGTRSAFTPAPLRSKTHIDSKEVTAQKRPTRYQYHSQNIQKSTLLTKCQRMGVFSFFLSTIRHFSLAKCYLFALFPCKMLSAIFCCWVVVLHRVKKNAFFLQKVCKKFAQYKIKLYFCVVKERAILNARELSRAKPPAWNRG